MTRDCAILNVVSKLFVRNGDGVKFSVVPAGRVPRLPSSSAAYGVLMTRNWILAVRYQVAGDDRSYCERLSVFPEPVNEV